MSRPGKVHSNLVYLPFERFLRFIGFFCSKIEIFLGFAGEKIRISLRTPSNPTHNSTPNLDPDPSLSLSPLMKVNSKTITIFQPT